MLLRNGEETAFGVGMRLNGFVFGFVFSLGFVWVRVSYISKVLILFIFWWARQDLNLTAVTC